MNVLFPENNLGKIKYYNVHYNYLLNILKENHEVKFYEAPTLGECCFVINIKASHVLIDFSDHQSVSKHLNKYPVCFKFHYSKVHKIFKNVYPFTPVSFHDWTDYKRGRRNLIYSCNSDIILNNQRPGGAAVKRRTDVQELLRKTYGPRIDTRFYPDQNAYWHKINDCLVHVFVPGATNNMLDRGHIQFMAFGCCTISPNLVEILPFNKKIQAGIHYVKCSDDYSDLIEKIEWCRKNKDECLQIGRNAAELFRITSTPKMLWEWILEKIQ